MMLRRAKRTTAIAEDKYTIVYILAAEDTSSFKIWVVDSISLFKVADVAAELSGTITVVSAVAVSSDNSDNLPSFNSTIYTGRLFAVTSATAYLTSQFRAKDSIAVPNLPDTAWLLYS
jgi:hypothetical protein